nr:ADP-ribosylglycohydrolase family protein [Azospirillum sp. SYSU D00513]
MWAAAGDALGWIAELTDEAGLIRRIGKGRLCRPVSWRRKIGGMNGATVQLPEGTYSDDTQLRIAVCRSIRGDGSFDTEAFAKIELPVWLNYSLGAGRGTKAAATNLSKRDVSWYSNFFTGGNGRGYVDAGGNGAAMRIQPHVWQTGGSAKRSYLGNVIRDAVVTHGHMRGILGAVFHADCVAYALREGRVPSPESWEEFIEDGFRSVKSALESDPQLSRFWLSSWEAESQKPFGHAIEATINEAKQLLRRLSVAIESPSFDAYVRVLDALDMRSEERRGAGLHSALAAVSAAWLYKYDQIEFALVEVVNVIGSDTDTIATMVGAILGATSNHAPEWPIQDHAYIVAQAQRLARIAKGASEESFPYPDLFSWQAPTTQSDGVGKIEDGLAIAGLGKIEVFGERWISGNFSWQWARLPFGQTVLCKMKSEMAGVVPAYNLPPLEQGKSRSASKSQDAGVLHQEKLPLNVSEHFKKEELDLRSLPNAALSHNGRLQKGRTLDMITDEVIRNNFDERVIGVCFLECLNSEEGIERAMAFSAILAKAHLARNRRNSRR